MSGMTFVDQVSAENPTMSPFLIFPRLRRAWMIARLAELPLLTITQCFLSWYLEKFFSNLAHSSA
ncbi:MAG: hypothetical protein ACD_13C00053G0001, partial [uncultured bacterium]